uniref:Retrovirus-related Pol polyprotein from transposon TNT 1-94 n=1 Tax=Tanacetum cinerariifolium TaxID=118510 RepID=A0A6L2NPE0_TANCI|nr:retrovirus-related Pol polyprotein from transposon TNT 1-94 [Tanacetum cinerariifolium]
MIVKQQHKLDEVSYHKLFDILKKYQKEVNELRAEGLARNANPLALVATAQDNQDPYYQTSKSHKSYAPSSKPLIPTRSHTTTRHKSKEIAKPITPLSETAFEEDNDPKQAQRGKDMQKNLALIAKYFKNIYKPTNNNLRTSSNSRNKNVDTTPRYKNDNQSGQFGNNRTMNVAGARENVGSPVVQQSEIQCFNCKEFRHFAKECRKPRRVKDFAYHKEKMLLCKQAEQGVPLQAEQYDWLADTDEEIDEQELEAHYNYMEKIQEVLTADSGTDSEPLEQVQNDAGYNVFSNDLQHSEQSKSFSNTCLVETDDGNVIPDSPDMCDDHIQNDQNDVESDDEQTSKSLGESISVRDSCLVALQTKQAEFEKYKAFNDRTVDYDKLEHNDSFLFVHELKQEMHDDLKYVESLEKEVDELESDKAEFLNMYDMILQECVSKDVMCSYLLLLSDLDALDELQCLYLHKVKECDCLAQNLSKQTESVSKEVHTELLQRFVKVEKHSIYLEIGLQKCEEQVKDDTVCNEKASNVFLKEREQYIKIQDLKAQLQDKNIAISALKKLTEKGKGKSVETKFVKPSVVRQPNAQRIPKPSVLGKPAPFSNSLERIYFSKTKSVPKTNVLEGLSKPVTAQTLPQTARQAESNENVLKLGMYRIDNMSTQTRAPQLPQNVRNTNPRVSTSTRVNHKTNVSRPQHRSNRLKDKVLPNNSQVKPKKTQVEVHPRIPSVSNKMKSVTACKDSLNSRTLNANAVCATCNKCLVDSNHFACVTKMLNDVNDRTRTKKPNVVHISTRKPKSQADKSVAIPHKKKIEQQSPSGYTWVPKTKMQWVPKAKNEYVQKRVLFVLAMISLCQFLDMEIWFKEMSRSTGFITSKVSITISSQLSHLNIDYINLLSKKDVVISLPKLKYVKDQLCSSFELSKANRSSFKSKAVPCLKGRLNLLHMDLCGPMQVASINGKKYILVIVYDYSRYTWTLFLRSKDEMAEVLKEFLMMIQRNLQALVITIRTDRGTEFLNKTLNAFFKEQGINHQTSTARTPEQNGVVERQNHTLVEAARTMLSDSKLPLFFWAEAIATTCYTQNRSIIISTHGKTPYHIINDRKPSIKHLYIFGCICYITRDGENLDKMKEKGDLYAHVPSQQELDLLFGPLYDEFFNACSNPQDKQPITNIQPTSAPSTPTYVHAEENNDDQAEEDHLPDD